MKIITGNTGMKHVTSDDDGAIYASIIGKDDYVLDMNDNFSYEVIDTNTIKINSGDALLNGRHIRTPRGSYDLVSIDNGQTGYNRIDLIVIRYESNGEIEQAYLHVIKGEQTTGVASVPTYETESILNGALIHDMPLYEVHLNGINLEEVKKVFGAKNLSTTNLGYRPNLLINSDFRNPINQRGQTSYSGASTSVTYTIDRWYMGKYDTTATLYVRDGYIEWTNSDTTYARYLSQLLERVLPNDYYTLSVNVKSLNGSCEVGLIDENNNGLGVLTLKNGFNHLTINGKIKRVQFKLMQNSSIQLEYIKLEQGSIATPFVPRPYGEELALCQRYYQTYNGRLLMGIYNKDYADGQYYFPVEMRTDPTVTFISCDYYDNSLGWVVPQSIELSAYHNSKYISCRLQRGSNDTFSLGLTINSRLDITIDAEIY